MPDAPAFYVWKPLGQSVSVHFDLDVIELLRRAILQARHSEAERRDEVGGFLLGRVEPGENIIVDGFELVHSEHKRGASFTLSESDCEKLEGRLQCWSKRDEEREPIGYFRSHTRAGLYLDQNDRQVISRFFSRASDVTLLVRPAADGTCSAGCFLWEDGEVQGIRTHLEFPFESRRLVAHSYDRALLQEPKPEDGFVVGKRRGPPILAPLAVLALVLLPLIALRAYRATSVRPEAPMAQSHVRVPAAKVHTKADSTVHANVEAEESIDGLAVIEERVKLSTSNKNARVSSLSPRANTPDTVAAVAQQPVNPDLPAAVSNLPAPPPLEGNSPVHFAVAPPVPTSPKTSLVRAASPTVVLEPVNESALRRAASHVPIFSVLQRHRFKSGDHFTPARPTRDIAPTVPRELRSNIAGAAPIDLKITIDKTGSVAETELLSKKADSALAELAVRTASRWDFIPARINSRAVTSEMLVHMRFSDQTAAAIPRGSTVAQR
ncbi:MAG: energy transducer TonB [Acidobacteriota bacterium]|nr:energy transducer TonB [Acidobacteriota bacterium]